MKRVFLVLITIFLLALTGCGGGGSDSTPVSSPTVSGMPEGVQTALDNYQKAMVTKDEPTLKNAVSFPFTDENQVTNKTQNCGDASAIFYVMFAFASCTHFDLQTVSYVSEGDCSGIVKAKINVGCTIGNVTTQYTNTVQLNVIRLNSGTCSGSWRISGCKTTKSVTVK